MPIDSAELRLRIYQDVLNESEGGRAPLNRDWLLGYTVDGAPLPLIDAQGRGIRNPAMWSHSLSITTVEKGRYSDEQISPGVWKYPLAVNKHGILDPSNVKFAKASAAATPVLYFYKPVPRTYLVVGLVEITSVDSAARVSTIELIHTGHTPGGAPTQLERAWVERLVETRLHQPRFRAVVLDAYRNKCAICGMPEPSLLDAAHIRGDKDPDGQPVVPNGLALCSIHHRAYDRQLIGIDGNLRLHVRPDIVELVDGPVLASAIQSLPNTSVKFAPRGRNAPDPYRLDKTYKEFLSALPA